MTISQFIRYCTREVIEYIRFNGTVWEDEFKSYLDTLLDDHEAYGVELTSELLKAKMNFFDFLEDEQIIEVHKLNNHHAPMVSWRFDNITRGKHYYRYSAMMNAIESTNTCLRETYQCNIDPETGGILPGK